MGLFAFLLSGFLLLLFDLFLSELLLFLDFLLLSNGVQLHSEWVGTLLQGSISLIVEESLLCSTSLTLTLEWLLIDLWSLILDLTGSCQRSVDLTPIFDEESKANDKINILCESDTYILTYFFRNKNELIFGWPSMFFTMKTIGLLFERKSLTMN